MKHLDESVIEADTRHSVAMFEDLFGPCRDFAVPLGHPRFDLTPANLETLRRLFPGAIWTTEPTTVPMGSRGESGGQVVPRFAPDGRWGAAETLAWMMMTVLSDRSARQSTRPV